MTFDWDHMPRHTEQKQQANELKYGIHINFESRWYCRSKKKQKKKILILLHINMWEQNVYNLPLNF